LSRLFRDLRLIKRQNWFMTVTVLLLLVVGVTFVYSSCYVSDEQPVRQLYKRQVMWVAAGVICYIIFAVTDYRILRKFSWWAYAVCLILLVIVLFVGTRVYGARRWLLFFGMGVQPSELTKLATIIVLARKLSRPGVNFGQFRSLVIVVLVVAVPVVLVVMEPDLGTAAVFLPVAFVMMIGAGVPLRTLGVLIIVGLLVLAVLLMALYVPEKLGAGEAAQEGIMRTVGLSGYHRDRLTVFFHPDKDPLGAGWNKRQSEIAVGSGGLWGKGFRKGTQNILGFLPRSVAPTDFIYSVIAEEMGFFGSVVVLLLFALVIVSGLRTALMAQDKMSRLLCTGIVTMVFFHVFVNIAMTVGLMPITGLPLPLLSYGGSFMFVTMSSLGIIQSVYIRSNRVGVVFEQCGLWAPVVDSGRG